MIMARGPRRPDEVVSQFADDCTKLYGDELRSVVLYGSGASQEYVPGQSDLNFMLVLTETGIATVEQAFKLVTKWRRRRVATPLLVTDEYIQSSLDVFPLEFLNISRHYRVLKGEDPLAGLEIDREKLRLQCEREVKGKLLQLRETYLSSEGRKRDILTIVKQSLTALVSIFHGLLYLQEKEIPSQRSAVIAKAAEEAGLDEVLFLRLLRVKEGTTKLSAAELQKLMRQYIGEVRRLAFWFDSLE
jgi:predicted nucleotidyltransferase